MTEAAYSFTSRETARLTTYRAAIAAGFYTDQCDRPEQSESSDAQHLLENTASYKSVEAQRVLVPTAPEIVNGDMKAPDSNPDENCGAC